MSGTQPGDPTRATQPEDLLETQDLTVPDDDVADAVRGGGIDGEAKDKDHKSWF